MNIGMTLSQGSRLRHYSGMAREETLLLILLLITVVGALYLFTTKWRRGADRSANLLNIRNCQQAMRGFHGTRNLVPGAPFPLYGGTECLTHYMAVPIPPPTIGGAYQFTEKITPYSAKPVGNSIAHLYVCGPSLALPVAGGKNARHSYAEPSETEGW